MKFCLCLFFVHVIFRGTDGISLPRSTAVLSEGRTSISITDIKSSGSPRHRRATRSNILPHSLSIQVDINGVPVRLDLIQNTQISIDVPAYLYDNGKLFLHQTRNIKEISSFYYDVSRGASVYIKCTEERKEDKKQCQKFEFFGCFATSQGQYVIEPLSTKSDVYDIPPGEVNTTQYRLVQLAESFDLHSDFIQVDPTTLKYEKQSTNHRRHKRDTAYKVELLLVTDYSVYRYWLSESSGNQSVAIDSLKTFYAFLFNGIQARYNNIDVNNLNIQIVFAGLIISRKSTDSPWTEKIKLLKNGQYSVSARDALNRFSQWIAGTTNTIPGHDHAMTFTRYNLETDNSYDTQGLAYVEGVCSNLGQSIVQSEFNFISFTIAAHELGHSLGALHDGIDNTCLTQANYVMSPTNRAVDGAITSMRSYVLNPWRFSSCSVTEMRKFLNSLNSSSNCLKTKDVWDNVTDLAPYLETKIGEIYDVNLQCEKAMGLGSVMCIGNYNNNFDTVCTGLWCLEPVYRNSCTLILPAGGTTCGNKEWCVNGVCVYDQRAPKVERRDCMYGDYLGTNCSTYVGQNPSVCYGSTASTCCDTCDGHYTGIKGCEYGDRNSMCSTISSGAQCYNNNDTCCQTCVQYETNIQGCRYGDRYVCSNITSRQCYGVSGQGSNVKDDCCKTCFFFYTGNSNCPYGDRIADCKSQDCWLYPSNLLNQCCGTCSSFLTTQVSTTTDSTTGSGSSLPNWVIPAAAGGGGLLLLIIIVMVLCCCCRKGSGDAKEPRYMVPPPKTISSNEYGRRPQTYKSEIRKGNDNYAYAYSSSGYIDSSKVQGPKATGGNRPLPPISQPQSNVPQRGASINSSNVYVEIQEPHEYQELPDARPSGSEYQKLQTRKPSGTYTKLQPNTQQYINRGYRK